MLEGKVCNNHIVSLKLATYKGCHIRHNNMGKKKVRHSAKVLAYSTLEIRKEEECNDENATYHHTPFNWLIIKFGFPDHNNTK